MKGRQGKTLRRQSAIERIELSIEKYEEILPLEKELLKLMRRKEKDLPPNNIPKKAYISSNISMNQMIEKKIKQVEKKLERAKQTLENTKANLKG